MGGNFRDNFLIGKGKEESMKEMKKNWQICWMKVIGFAFALCLLQLGFISTAEAFMGNDEIRVKKIWEDPLQPGAAEVTVVVQGTIEGENLSPAELENFKYSFILNEANSWEASQLNAVTEYHNKKVEYIATETTQVSGYTTRIERQMDPQANGSAIWVFTVTNSRYVPLTPYVPREEEEEEEKPKPQGDEVEIIKKWVGGEPEGVDEILVQMIATVTSMRDNVPKVEEQYGHIFRLTKADGWADLYTVPGDAFRPGYSVKYEIREITQIPGYTSEVGEFKLVDADRPANRGQKWICTVTNTKVEEPKPEPKPESESKPEPESESKPEPQPDESLDDNGIPMGNAQLPKTSGVPAGLVWLVGAMIVSGGYALKKRK